VLPNITSGWPPNPVRAQDAARNWRTPPRHTQ
jgi:hypothetical protein